MHFLPTLILGAISLVCAIVALALLPPFLAEIVAAPALQTRRPRLVRLAFAAGLFLALFSPRLALAATGAGTQSVDLSAIWQIVLTFAGTAVTVGVPLLVTSLNARFKLQAGSQAADDLDQALEHGIAVVLDTVKSIASHNEVITVPVGAFGTAAALVAKLAPAAINYLGITPAEIEAMITARISDAAQKPVIRVPVAPASPSISAAPSASVTAG